MNGVHALKLAWAAGIWIAIDGDVLRLEAVDASPPLVLAFRVRDKAQVIALLRLGSDGWSGEDWQAFVDDRAHIAKFDGGLPRDQAETRAFACCAAEWLHRKPARTPSGRCDGCGEAEHGDDPLLPFGTEPTGHAWLHLRYWPAWHASRKAEAVAALATFEIHETRTSP